MSNVKLTKYTKATKAVADFKTKHAKLFGEYQSLLLKQEDDELALRVEVRDVVKQTIANDFIEVTYTPVWLKSYDHEIIMGGVTPKVRKEMIADGVIVTKVTIDKKELETFVKNGKLPADVKQAAFSEKESTPRIKIVEVKK